MHVNKSYKSGTERKEELLEFITQNVAVDQSPISSSVAYGNMLPVAQPGMYYRLLISSFSCRLHYNIFCLSRSPRNVKNEGRDG